MPVFVCAESTNVIQVEIDAAIVHQDEISDSVDSLHRESVSVVRAKKPRVVCLDKITRALLRPKLHGAHGLAQAIADEAQRWEASYPVLPVRVRIGARLADMVPVGRQRFVPGVVPIVEDLMDDFWY